MIIKKLNKIRLEKGDSIKPIIIKFRRKDGTIAEFKAIKIIKKPRKIIFRKIKKDYKRI